MKTLFASLQLVLKFPRIVALALGVFALISLAAIPNLQLINNTDSFHIPGIESTTQYDALKKEFGNDEFFLVLFEGKDLLREEVLDVVTLATDKLEKLNGIRKARSISNIERINGEEEYFSVETLLPSTQLSQDKKEEVQKLITTNPLYEGAITNSKLEALAIGAWVEDRPKEPNFRKLLIKEVEDILQKTNTQEINVTYRIAGWTVTNVALSKYSQEDLIKFIPISYFLMLALIYFAFRSIRYTIVSFGTISLSFIYVVALFPLLGIPLTQLTSAALPVILCLSVADSIHIFNYLSSQNFNDRLSVKDNVTSVLKRAAFPCLLTSITTSFGFLSFCWNDLESLAQFGLLAGIGMIVEFIVTFTAIPVCILLSRSPEHYFGKGKKQVDKIGKPIISSLLEGVSALTRRYALHIVIISTLLFVFLGSFIPQLSSNSSIIDYLDDSLPERQDVYATEELLGGLQTFDIVLIPGHPQAFKEPGNLAILEQVHNITEDHKEISKATSFVTFIKEMNKAFHADNQDFYRIPDSPEAISQYLLLYDSVETADVVNEDYSQARIIVRTTMRESAVEAAFVSRLRAELQTVVPSGTQLIITGRMIDQIAVSNAITYGQIQSLSIAFVMVIIVLSLGLRDIRLGLVSLLPNIIPVIACFSAMVLLDIPLDTGTSLIAAIVLGIAVDDTIHFLFNLRDRLSSGTELTRALSEVVQFKGMAIGTTSLVITCGFGVLYFGSFVPTQRFGILTAIVMMVAPLADLIFLPALLLTFPSITRSLSKENTTEQTTLNYSAELQ